MNRLAAQPGNSISCLAIDNDNNIWASVSDYNVVKFDGVFWTIYSHTNSNLPEHSTNVIEIDSFNKPWVACGFELFKLNDIGDWEKQGFPEDLYASVQELAFDSQNNAWLGNHTQGYGLFKLTQDTCVRYSNPMNLGGILIDANDKPIVGTTTGSVARLDAPYQWFDFDGESPLYDGRIRILDISYDSTGCLWFATGEGLAKLDFNPSNSLIHSKHINGNDPESFIFSYNPTDGLLSIYNAAKRSAAGMLYVFNGQGAIEFQVRIDFEKNNKYTIKLPIQRAGVYFCQLRTEYEDALYKFVKYQQ